MPPIVKLDPARTAFFLCDMQTRFKPAIYGFDEIVLTVNKMLKIAKLLNIPVVVTEQNPKGLGPTTPEINLDSLGDLRILTVEKVLFSMMTPDVKAQLQERPHIRSVVLFGIESHVCVLQTALDLLDEGYDVHVLADGVSSCNPEEVPVALSRMQQVGAYITTSESAAFQLQRGAGTAQFKEFSKIIKDEKDNTTRAMQKLVQFRSSL
ncbi:Isochorismatase-like protein [Pisolithus marmoratus]|nr:Isochorismatase-like protein [Pisolithus marmoratus]